MTTVEAIYEQGVLKLKEPVALPDGAHVKVTIAEDEVAPQIAETKSPAEIMAEIAALSNPVKPGDEYASVEHDKHLYGWDKS